MDVRVTDLLVDLLDRYEPEPLVEDTEGFVSEESGGLQAFGLWELLADAPVSDVDEVMAILDRLELRDDPDFTLDGDFLAVPADALTHSDLIALLEAVDATSDLLEVAGEVDVHETPLTWTGSGDDREPAPVLERPADEVPLLVDEVAIHLKRHAAAPAEENGDRITYGVGVELFGRPYVILRDAIQDTDAVARVLADAGLPAPAEMRAHRVEWGEKELEPEDVYAIVNALRDVNPVAGFTAGVTWRNESFRVEPADET